MSPIPWFSKSQTVTAALMLVFPLSEQTLEPSSNLNPQRIPAAGEGIGDRLQIDTPDCYNLEIPISEKQQLEALGSFAARLVAETKDLDPDIVEVIEEKWWDLI